MGPLSYDDALAALSRALVFGIHPSLEGISALCEQLGGVVMHPHLLT